jgi:ribosomal protein S18 acetylase RimI-like enzyme
MELINGGIRMAIQELNLFNIDQAYTLWNSLITSGEVLYKPMTKEKFISSFLPSSEISSWCYVEDEKLLGFISGVMLPERKKAYLSMIMVDPKYQRKHIGKRLLSQFESIVKEHTIYPSIDLVFFNPIQFEWIIPNTINHDHPNAPGVDIQSAAYQFFKQEGYHDFAIQNSYYKDLKDYQFEPEMNLLIDDLQTKDITITYYDSKKHHGFNELFDDLKNPYWRDEITKAIQHDEPVLIAEHQGEILGFTGPLRVQPSLRGYFAGIGVHSKTRGLGVGKVLFASLCYELKQRGAHYMTLFTGETNPARKIYEREGFKIVKTWADMRNELTR